MADAYDAEVWMNEKEPLVTNPDFGKDEDTAQVRSFFFCFLFLGLLECVLNLFAFLHTSIL